MMKTKSATSRNLLHNCKKIWFGLQLLIVSIALPLICFVQIYYTGTAEKSKDASKQNNALLVNKTEPAYKATATINLPE